MKTTPNWQAPTDFVPLESALPGISVFGPSAPDDQANQPQSFKCPQCGASTRFDVAAGGVACEHCGYTTAPQAEKVGLQAQGMEFTLETLSKAHLGWGLARKEMHCDSCGADMVIPEKALSATCPFCASNRVNVREAPTDQLRPRFLIPFKIQPQATRALAQQWLGQGWYHPEELGTSAMVDRFVGIYLPFWTFSANIGSNWKAQVGYETQERYFDDEDKTWKTRTRIEWRWENGQVRLGVANLLVCGSSRISKTLLEKLYPFHLNELVSYAPDFLAGWQAQTYDLTLPQAWEQGKAAMREQAKKACHADIKSSHVRNFSMTADFDDESRRYVLLPVYVAAYKIENKIFQVISENSSKDIQKNAEFLIQILWITFYSLLGSTSNYEAFYKEFVKIIKSPKTFSKENLSTFWKGMSHFVKVNKLKKSDLSTFEKLYANQLEREKPLLKNQNLKDEEKVVIHNAGLVLTAAFLPRFFENLGLVKGGKFTSENSQEDAVILLQSMIPEQAGWEEPDLLLNKLLCGIEPSTSLDVSKDLDQKFIQEIDLLLESMATQWTALKSKSGKMVSEGFFAREGILKKVQGGYHLQIQRLAFDILLDRLPWSIGIIKLPWMEEIISVEW